MFRLNCDEVFWWVRAMFGEPRRRCKLLGEVSFPSLSGTHLFLNFEDDLSRVVHSRCEPAGLKLHACRQRTALLSTEDTQREWESIRYVAVRVLYTKKSVQRITFLSLYYSTQSKRNIPLSFPKLLGTGYRRSRVYHQERTIEKDKSLSQRYQIKREVSESFSTRLTCWHSPPHQTVDRL